MCFAAMLGIIGFAGPFLDFYLKSFCQKSAFYPLDGKDLNPILQDIGMIFHPPLFVRFLGYAGLALVFCLGIAGLVKGKLLSQEVSSDNSIRDYLAFPDSRQYARILVGLQR